MRPSLRRYAKSQGGYTLVELMVASAIGLFVMSGLTSVVMTSWRAGSTATSRVEASGQIRSFQFRAYDDFALADVPVIESCNFADPPPCTITLSGWEVTDSSMVPFNYQVTYTWDGVNLDRQVKGSDARHVATNVSAFSVDLSGTYPNQTVAVTLTVTLRNNAEVVYSETQTLRFDPRANP
jgi:prepilin-type N-terminal cleavage/methylation domain-containing protein